MPDNTFDVVSKVELPEVSNSIQQSMKEITTRFDLKDSNIRLIRVIRRIHARPAPRRQCPATKLRPVVRHNHFRYAAIRRNSDSTRRTRMPPREVHH